jgi:hypothetical protein
MAITDRRAGMHMAEYPAFRRFMLRRHEDVTGLSGTGDVAWGCVFPDGKAVVRWRSEHGSTVVWDREESIEAIHGHVGKTETVWLDEE